MDLFKMANQLAKNMSESDKDAIEGMDMEKMISHVTQNVFKMMGQTGSGDETGAIPDIMNMMSGMSGLSLKKQESILPKTRDICFDLNVDLEDFYTGKKKKINVKRKRIIEVDGKQKVVEEKKKIVIPIEKGMKDEQQIVFEGEADQIPGYDPGDIIITLIEKEHPIFERENDNLIIVKNINMYELYDITFDVTTLDDRILRINKIDADSLHLNESIRKISGEGMPIYKSNGFGNLFIRFNLVIPKTISPDKLNVFKQIFESTEELSDTFSKVCVLENISETDVEDLDYSSGSDESESDSESSGSETSSISSDEDVPKKRLPKRK